MNHNFEAFQILTIFESLFFNGKNNPDIISLIKQNGFDYTSGMLFYSG